MPLTELAAKLLLEPRKPALDGGLAPAQGFGCRDCATRPRDSEEVAQVIPVEHCADLMQFGRMIAQSCGSRQPPSRVKESSNANSRITK
jgi:hypothetical protein